jgi:hypothetical protein
MCFPNYVDSDMANVVMTGGNWVLPLENLKNPRLSLPAKSANTTTTSTWFDTDLGKPRDILVAAIPSTNSSLDGKKRLRITDKPKFSNSTVVGGSGSIGGNSVSFKAPGSSAITITAGDFFTIKGYLYKSNTTVTIAAGASSTISLATASGNDIHNSTLRTTVALNDAVRCNTGDYTTTLYDSGSVDIYGIIYPFGTLSWTHPSFWTGKATEEDRKSITFPIIDFLDDLAIIGEYCRYDFDDQTNTAGYFSLSRVFFTPGWQPSINPIYGLNVQYNTDTSSDKSFGGERSYSVKKPYRTLAFTIDDLPKDEALSKALEAQRVQGIDKQMFFILDPEDTINMHRLSFTATLQNLSPLSYAYFNALSFNGVLEEVIGGNLI